MKFATLALLCLSYTLFGAVNLDRPLLAQSSQPNQTSLPPFYAGQLPANSQVKPPVVEAQHTEPAESARSNAAQIYDGLPRPSAARPADRVEPRRDQPSTARGGDTGNRRDQRERGNEQDPTAKVQEDRVQKEKDSKDKESKDEDEDEDDLLEHIRAMDRVLESSPVQRILSLMAENMELKSQMRIREAESKMQLEMMEQRLEQMRDSQRRPEASQPDSPRPRDNFGSPAVPVERDSLAPNTRGRDGNQAQPKPQEPSDHPRPNFPPLPPQFAQELRLAEQARRESEGRARDLQAQLSELQRRMEQMHNSQQRTQKLHEQNQELRMELSRRDKAAREAIKDAQTPRANAETKKKKDSNDD
jgi:hypothetical protein